MDRLVLLGTVKDIEKTMDAYAIKGENGFSGARSYMDFMIPALGNTKIISRQSNRQGISYGRKSINREAWCQS